MGDSRLIRGAAVGLILSIAMLAGGSAGDRLTLEVPVSAEVDSLNDYTGMLWFTADWCRPCRAMRPTIARMLTAGLAVRIVDVDAEPGLAKRFAVRRVPTAIAVAGGRERDRVVGVVSGEKLLELLAPALPAWRTAGHSA